MTEPRRSAAASPFRLRRSSYRLALRLASVAVLTVAYPRRRKATPHFAMLFEGPTRFELKGFLLNRGFSQDRISHGLCSIIWVRCTWAQEDQSDQDHETPWKCVCAS